MDTTTNGVGQGIVTVNAGWNFSGQVAQSFPEHVRRSIPSYEAGHRLVAEISDFFVRPDSVVYELGTSHGELLCALAERHRQRPETRWIGIDNEPDMVAKARTVAAGLDNVVVENADIVEYELVKTDLVVSYYCLQFIAPKHRQRVVDRIYDALNWGGAFIWFEKVRGSDARFQDLFSLLYTDFKLDQGFTADEVLAKSRSLKSTLEPFSSTGNLDLLKRAGFVDITPVFRHLCFEGVLAIK
ncbi:methyltransferase domain-containing protein [Micromonospora sp. NPDC048170]|uniref:methyltransferase domain-containing protein n=1 Tax=Micromonospora sp. NPDC048170 TaxID=3154819 RepID=UPI0033FFA218